MIEFLWYAVAVTLCVIATPVIAIGALLAIIWACQGDPL